MTTERDVDEFSLGAYIFRHVKEFDVDYIGLFSLDLDRSFAGGGGVLLPST